MRSRALAVRRTQRNKAINLSEEKLTEMVNARRGKKNQRLTFLRLEDWVSERMLVTFPEV